MVINTGPSCLRYWFESLRRGEERGTVLISIRFLLIVTEILMLAMFMVERFFCSSSNTSRARVFQTAGHHPGRRFADPASGDQANKAIKEVREVPGGGDGTRLVFRVKPLA